MSEPPSTEPSSTERQPVGGVRVAVTDEQTDHPIDTERWARLATHALADRGIAHGELSLWFVDEEAIAALNAEHMGAHGPTDVLAFPLDVEDGAATNGSEMPTLLGDVVICPSVAARHAADHAAGASEPHPGHPTHGGTLDDEIALLLVHGILHVLGHDHTGPDDTAVMHAAERELLVAATSVVDRGADR